MNMENMVVIIIAIISGLTTYTISIIMGKGSVFASATVTLVAGIIFPYFFAEFGKQLTTVAACASYAGMVSAEIVPSLKEMLAVSVIVGIMYIATLTAYKGVGGRLGTIAAVSCFIWIGLKKMFTRIYSNN